MKKSVIFLLGFCLSAGACAPVYGPPVAPAPGVGYAVAVGDRPYYTRGPYYVYHGRRYVWVSGHWSKRYGRRVWIHGHYVLRY
jgi:hypothetical protein